MKPTAAAPFSPQYQRFTPTMVGALMRIAGALETIRGARVLPAAVDQMRSSARAGTVHYSNLIEGNELPAIEAERAARRELDSDTHAKLELVNYVRALDLLDERVEAGTLELTPDFLRELHGVTTAGLGRDDDPHFKPHHEGEWRDGIAVVQDRMTGKTMHVGDSPEQVPGKMEAMFEWLQRATEAGVEPPFVLAGVMHYGVTDVHPFADGNGRVARLFQAAVMMDAGVLPGRIFSFERYYAEARDAYYAALRSVRARTLNMEHWLHYFLEGLAQEYERVTAIVNDLSSLTENATGGPLRLSPSQEEAITALRLQGRREFTRREYEEAAGVGRSTAASDLSTLVSHGFLVPRGSGRGSRYEFARSSRSLERPRDRRGRPVVWNEAKIERELRDFLAGRSGWPTPEEFRAADAGPLYAAASKNGGIGRWRRIVGR